MENFSLMVRSIVRNFRSKPGVYLFFIFSGVAGFLSFLVLYVNAMPYLKINSSANSSFRLYTFQISSIHTDYSVIDDLLTLNEYESFQLYTPVSGQEGTNFTTFLNRSSFVAHQLSSAGYESSYDLNENEALLGLSGVFAQDSTTPIQIGTMTELGGYQYNVAGGWMDADIMINPDTFHSRYGYNRIVFRTMDVLSPEENRQLITRINDAFPIDSSSTPIDITQNTISQTPMVLTVITLVYLVGLLSYVQILSTIVLAMKLDIKIYRTLGMTERGANKIVVWTAICLNLIIILLGTGLHALLWPPFFSKISYWGVESFGTFDYGIAGFFTLVLSLMVSIPYVIRWNKRALNELKAAD